MFQKCTLLVRPGEGTRARLPAPHQVDQQLASLLDQLGGCRICTGSIRQLAPPGGNYGRPDHLGDIRVAVVRNVVQGFCCLQ
jgi:hypothetical protein